MHEQFEVTDDNEETVLKALAELEDEAPGEPFTLVALYWKR